MRRRSFLAGLFAVPVAVACEPVRGVSLVRPGSSGGAVVAGQAEDWHYVGAAGEPAFENSWANASSPGDQNLGFRIREAGVVDVQGWIADGTPGATVFTLPADYRPSGIAWVTAVGEMDLGGGSYESVPVMMLVDTSGTVTPRNVPNSADAGIRMSGQFFLTPATGP